MKGARRKVTGGRRQRKRTRERTRKRKWKEKGRDKGGREIALPRANTRDKDTWRRTSEHANEKD